MKKKKDNDRKIFFDTLFTLLICYFFGLGFFFFELLLTKNFWMSISFGIFGSTSLGFYLICDVIKKYEEDK